MILFTVESVEVTQRPGMMKNNKPYPREQVIYAHITDKEGKRRPHPVEAKHTLWENDEPLKVGQYTLAPQSVYVDQYGKPALAPKYVPVPASGRGGA